MSTGNAYIFYLSGAVVFFVAAAKLYAILLNADEENWSSPVTLVKDEVSERGWTRPLIVIFGLIFGPGLMLTPHLNLFP